MLLCGCWNSFAMAYSDITQRIALASSEAHSCVKSVTQWATVNVKFLLFVYFLSALGTWLAPKIVRKLGRSRFARPSSPDLEKPTNRNHQSKDSESKVPARTPGTWTPVDFKRPEAAPYPDWDVHTTKPLPYRPFRFGPYHITMGLRTMKWDEWIELDNQYPKFHAQKARRIEERGPKCCKTAPEAFDGACELLEEL